MARTTQRPLPAWDALWPSYLRPLKVLSSLHPHELLWWRTLHPRLRWWRQGRFPRSRLRLRPPPPPPAEPYEVFMARVQRDLSSLPVRSAQSGAAVPPRPAVATPTTGSRLPTPFPRFEDSSWALQPQAPNITIRMPLPASCYMPPPSPWGCPGRGSSVDTTMVRGPPPATLPAGPPGPYGPSGLLAGPSAVGPSPVPPPTTPAADPKKDLSYPPPAFEDFFRVTRPLLSLLRHRPAWTLLLLRWRSKTLGPSPRDQPRRWSKGGRRNSWWTWEPIGSSS